MFLFYLFALLNFVILDVNASCWCKPGTFMNASCSAQTDGCLQCPPGKYMDVHNNETHCKRCYPSCDGGRVTVQFCTSTSNRVCQCPTTKYWDTLLHMCRDCTECENGQRKVEHCGSERDSVCQDCPEGTYLSQDMCNKCKMCKKGQVVVEECSTTQDTICKAVATPELSSVITRTELNSSMATRTDLHVEQSTESSIGERAGDVTNTCLIPDIQMALIWGSGIGFSLAVVLILVFLWLFRKRSGQKTLDNGSPVAEVVSKEKMKESIKEKGLKVRDLNYSYIERLSALLNPQAEKNWKSLAGLMNYSVDFVANLELQPQIATSKLLQDWGVSNDATVYRLYCFLKRLGRDDAAEVLTSPLLGKQTAEYV